MTLCSMGRLTGHRPTFFLFTHAVLADRWISGIHVFNGSGSADEFVGACPAELANYVNPVVSIIIFLAITVVAPWGALRAMERKDVS